MKSSISSGGLFVHAIDADDSGVVHRLGLRSKGVSDYIAMPKANNYQVFTPP